ncbi:IclR family transcriptional regulator [Cohaesibacter celericrescens]|uniref:IclR family transcriptional regulator n=1 Tax=Cohaesibacter celericrescens TaxID=2067669 RepID=A0A2N5XNJ7_9HYPH|nr:IclR family transcriptional regulator [Cohaesibacter celericrescens]PLW75987.1 IclR family transcriptional regulator [Cohaesibacter celericrescens]
MSEAKGVEAVERALSILDCFEPDTTELSLAEIARHTGLYKSTILRLAVSLERFGYLVRGEGSRFRVGPTAWRLGANYRQSFDLAAVIRPQLKQLSEATNETASFYVKEGRHRVCLFRHEPPRAIRHTIQEGVSLPLVQGASGKILQIFAKIQQDYGTEEDARVRSCGIAISMGERDVEVAAIATPILSTSGGLVGALAVSGLITRFGPDRQEEMTILLKDYRKALEKMIIC